MKGLALLLETKRQLFHLAIGTAIAALVVLLPKNLSLSILFIFTILIYLMRHSYKTIYPLKWLVETFDRPQDEKTGNPFKGALHLVIGTAAALMLFPPLPAAAGILVLAWGDSLATLIGRHHGKKKIYRSKTAEGTLAFFISALLALTIFTSVHQAFTIAILATIIELYSPIDDNLIIPAATAFFLTTI